MGVSGRERAVAEAEAEVVAEADGEEAEAGTAVVAAAEEEGGGSSHGGVGDGAGDGVCDGVGDRVDVGCCGGSRVGSTARCRRSARGRGGDSGHGGRRCGVAAGAAVLLWPHDSKPCGSRLCGSERTGLGVVALAVPGLADRGAGMSGGESGSVVGEGSRSCGDEDMSPTDAGGSAADARAASALQSPLLLLLLTPLVAPPSPAVTAGLPPSLAPPTTVPMLGRAVATCGRRGAGDASSVSGGSSRGGLGSRGDGWRVAGRGLGATNRPATRPGLLPPPSAQLAHGAGGRCSSSSSSSSGEGQRLRHIERGGGGTSGTGGLCACIRAQGRQ